MTPAVSSQQGTGGGQRPCPRAPAGPPPARRASLAFSSGSSLGPGGDVARQPEISATSPAPPSPAPPLPAEGGRQGPGRSGGSLGARVLQTLKLLRVGQTSSQVPLAFLLGDSGDSDVAQPLRQRGRGLVLVPPMAPRAQTRPWAHRGRRRAWQGSAVLGVSEPWLWAGGLRREEGDGE